MRLTSAALAGILLCSASPALAQDPRGKPITAPAGSLSGTAIYCDDGTNHAILCPFAGGGGGGDPSSTGTVGGTTPPATVGMIGGYDGAAIRRLAVDGSGRIAAIIYSLPAITGTVGITGPVAVTGTFWQATQPVSAASLPLPTGAATATAQATNTAAITATQATTGMLASTATTVTTTLPQLTASAGLAITFGTTAATLFNANAGRHFIAVQVQGTTGGCYINGTASASADANSLYIPAGGYFESSTHVGTGAVSIVCTAAAVPVYSRQG